MKRAPIGLPIAFALAGCVHTEAVGKIRAGMDRSQVAALMGPPRPRPIPPAGNARSTASPRTSWSRVPWCMTDRYYVCFSDGKVETFGVTDQKSG